MEVNKEALEQVKDHAASDETKNDRRKIKEKGFSGVNYIAYRSSRYSSRH